MIESLKSPRGGWSKAALEVLGVPWPPKKGWKYTTIGKYADSERVEALKQHHANVIKWEEWE
jgi:hypothetical protein